MERMRPKWLKSTKGAPFTGIGSLEADILAIIWERQRATVRDVYETLREQRTIAYTTVMTVMNNLVKKELLSQDRTAIAYVYTPAIPGNEVASTILDSVVQRLFRGRANLALSHLLGLKRDLNPEQAEELRKYARSTSPPEVAAEPPARATALRRPTAGRAARAAGFTCSAARSPRGARGPWPGSCGSRRRGRYESRPPRDRR